MTFPLVEVALHHCEDRVEHVIDFFEDVFVPEAEDLKPEVAKVAVSFAVIAALSMLGAVEFDDQAMPVGEEVHDVAADGFLSPPLGFQAVVR